MVLNLLKISSEKVAWDLLLIASSSVIGGTSFLVRI